MTNREGSRVRPRTWLAGGALICASLVALLGAGAVRFDVRARAGDSCGGADRPLSVFAAPEIAGIVADLVRATDPGRRTHACPPPAVTAIDPAEVADAIAQERGDRPDVWIPDSSIWINRRAPAGRGLPQHNHSVARTPIVVALPEDAAAGLGWPQRWPGLAALLPAEGSPAGPVQFSLADPTRSAATVGVLLGLQSAGAGRSDVRAALTSVLRAAAPSAERPDRLLMSLRRGAALAVPATEQQIWARNAQQPDTRVVAVYPAGSGYSFDYPYLVLAAEHAQRVRAERLLAQLTGELGRGRLRAAGFRDPDGTADAQLAASTGVDPARAGAGPAPDADSIDAATRTLTSLTLGSRLLAVVDVSGSMAEPVPGAGRATKLDLALGAAVNGLALYPDDTMVGLWTFATNLSEGTDHRELVPIVRLGRGGDGTTGRERLAQALGGIHPVVRGNTGLYDTALAAVRAVRRDWDPARVNSVILLTDGRNDDSDGISLDQLTTALRGEDDPARPVFLITIGYGPDSDQAALTAMSRATGGEMYLAQDPRRIREVVLDAIGRRACRPNC